MNDEIWEILSKRWSLRILKSLELNNAIRFNELKQSVHGLSSNVLSDRLDELEKWGLVQKIITKEGTSHIGYVLDEKCRKLKEILLNLDEWISSLKVNDITQNKKFENSTISKQLLELLQNEVTKTEFNFIKDKLLFSLGIDSSELFMNFDQTKNVILELYGEERGNNILKKLNDKIKSLQMDH